MSDVVIVSGEGRYADPWHDFAGTSRRVADLLAERGLDVVVRGAASTVPETARLLVVNAGGGAQAEPPVAGDAEGAWHEAVLTHARSGRPVLALHAASNTFYEDGRWAQVLGGRWVPGTSMHPPGGPATVQVSDVEHPITAGLPHALAIEDERYSYLEVHPTAVPLLTHVHDDVVHPIVWAHSGEAVRVVVDTLGHDLRAYGQVRADLLAREVTWLLT